MYVCVCERTHSVKFLQNSLHLVFLEYYILTIYSFYLYICISMNRNAFFHVMFVVASFCHLLEIGWFFLLQQFVCFVLKISAKSFSLACLFVYFAIEWVSVFFVLVMNEIKKTIAQKMLSHSFFVCKRFSGTNGIKISIKIHPLQNFGSIEYILWAYTFTLILAFN